MNTLKIDVKDDELSFRPGQDIRGKVYWELADKPKKACLRLLWFITGKGTEDVEVIDSINFEEPSNSDSRQYEFKLPVAPYSFSGKLISLQWALELEVGRESMQKSITVSPTGQEIMLYPERTK